MKSGTLRKLMSYIGAYKFMLVLSILLSLVTVALTLYIPILFGQTIDHITVKGCVEFEIIGTYLTKIVCLIIVCSISTWIMNRLNNHMTYHVMRDIRAKVIRKIQVLPLRYTDNHTIGDITSRMIADIDQISDGLLLGFTKLFSGIFTIVITLVFMFSRSVSVSLLVIALTPVSFFVSKYIASHTFDMSKKQVAKRGEQTGFIEEMVGNAGIVKAFSHEKQASEDFSKLNHELYEFSWRAVFFSSLTNPCTRAVNSVIYAAVALLGSYQILGGMLTVGGLTVLLSYANQYMKPFNDIASVVTELQNAFACCVRVFDLLEAEEEVKDEDVAIVLKDGAVDLNDVSFSYVEGTPFIEKFSLHANPGETIAIVGPTGCGKTTLINLLMRFFEIDDGSIMIDGQDITSVSRESLRESFGMVLQDTWLKNATVRENIAFGKPDASDEEIIAACKEAHSWSFIKRLPKKMDTVLTENSLSAGQKQLLCITRVMLYDPSILILDEATSSIDTRTEIRIQRAFDKLMKGRTSFVVAHRLSTIRNADQIVVMKDGKIIEHGNHDSLMKENGFYTNLYNSQFAQS